MRLLDRAEQLLSRSIDTTLRHSRKVIGLTLVWILSCAYLSSHIGRTVSIEDQLDPNLESTLDLKRDQKLFGQQQGLGFIVPSATYKDLCILQKLIPDLATEFPDIEKRSDVLGIRQAHFEKGILTYPSVLGDPCLKVGATPFESAPFLDSPWRNSLVSEDTQDFLTVISLPFDARQTESIMKTVQSAFKKEILWTGILAHDFYTDQGMDQSIWQNILIFFIIFVAFRLAFGTFRSCFIYFGTLGVSVLSVYGGMALAGEKLDPLGACLFLMLTVAALEDFVFLSYSQMDDSAAIQTRSAYQALALPCLLTSITTLIAFGSLVLSPLVSIRHFGLWASFGSAMEWVSVFYILPAFTKEFKMISAWTRFDRAWFRNILARFVHRAPSRNVSRLSLLFFIGAIYSVTHARISQTPTEMFPASHPFQKAIDYVRSTRGWVADARVVFESGVSLDKKNQVLAQIKDDPLVVKIERFKDLEDYVSRPVTDPLLKALISREIRSASYASSFLAASGEEQAFLYLETTTTQKVNLLRDRVSKLCPASECFITGEFIAYADFSKHLLQTLFDSLAVSLFLVAIVLGYLTYALGEMKHFGKLIITSFWGPAVLLTCISAFGISINFITCIVASVLVGLTGDNAIQFLLAKKEGSLKTGIERRGHSAIQCSIIMAACTLSFAISYFEPARTLGYLLSSGFIFALLGDFWILQGFLQGEPDQGKSE